MTEPRPLLHFRRSTSCPERREGLAATAGLAPLRTPVELAPLMLAAYRGTPDDEGESLEDTVGVIEEAMNGRYGRWLSAASFEAIADDEPVGAVLTVLDDDEPFIAFLFTRPDRVGAGIATGLIAGVCDALARDGHDSITLWVNPANTRAVRLYRHLGFAQVQPPGDGATVGE